MGGDRNGNAPIPNSRKHPVANYPPNGGMVEDIDARVCYATVRGCTGGHQASHAVLSEQRMPWMSEVQPFPKCHCLLPECAHLKHGSRWCGIAHNHFRVEADCPCLIFGGNAALPRHGFTRYFYMAPFWRRRPISISRRAKFNPKPRILGGRIRPAVGMSDAKTGSRRRPRRHAVAAPSIHRLSFGQIREYPLGHASVDPSAMQNSVLAPDLK